jgi:hypothetical protein
MQSVLHFALLKLLLYELSPTNCVPDAVLLHPLLDPRPIPTRRTLCSRALGQTYYPVSTVAVRTSRALLIGSTAYSQHRRGLKHTLAHHSADTDSYIISARGCTASQ